jgi:hypothetical protein
MNLFGGLNLGYDNAIYLSIIDSSGIVLSKSKFPHEEGSAPALCSLLSAFSSAYRSPLILTLSKLDKWLDRLIAELQKLPLRLLALNDSQSIKSNFYKSNQNPFEDYDPYEKAIELALLGALGSWK